MTCTSLSKRIETYLKARNCWVSGDTLEKLAQEAKYKANTASRRARELAESNILERRETRQGYVEYRYKPQKKIISGFEEVETPEGIVAREVKREIMV